MASYRQLAPEERYQIYALIIAGHRQRRSRGNWDVTPGTISRELRRNRGRRGYCFFAHPYHSWERGLNENTNGLVRQYFPKRSDFSKITEADLRRVMDRLNHRPRKTLNFRTPHQVFFRTKDIALTI